MSRELPSFDLVVATVGRAEELGRFLDSVEAQGYPHVRVIVVDQNADERIGHVLGSRSPDVLHLSANRGLSRARNAALPHLNADLVAFPDDDCEYPAGLLGRVAQRFRDDPALDGLTGRTVDAGGRSSASWEADRAKLTIDNLWNRANAATVFLRRDAVERVGDFDERLGLGSAQPWSSGEEIDYLVRSLLVGARIEYDPSLLVLHAVREDDSHTGYRDGASVGYLLRKHHYPASAVARMLVRPAGGVLVSLLRLDRKRARFHAATLRGRVHGLRASGGTS